MTLNKSIKGDIETACDFARDLPTNVLTVFWKSVFSDYSMVEPEIITIKMVCKMLEKKYDLLSNRKLQHEIQDMVSKLVMEKRMSKFYR